MDINEITMWVSHAGTSLGVNGDAYGAKMPGEAVESLRARLAEVEAQRNMLREYMERLSCLGNGDASDEYEQRAKEYAAARAAVDALVGEGN